MEEFIDHITFVCLSGAVIGGALALIVSVGEYIDKKLDGKLSDYVVRLFGEEE